MKMSINSEEHCIADFHTIEGDDLFAKTRLFGEFLTDWKQKGNYAYHRILTGECTRRAEIFEPETTCLREMTVLCSNNYLGLNTRPEVKLAAEEALKKYGTGMSGSRFLSGTYDLVVELERQLAAFEQTESAAVFTSGYQANVGTLSALMRPKDVAVIDHLAHASMVDGCRLAQCNLRTFRHNDVNHLEKVLKKCEGLYAGKMIVVDGVFSMDGDRAPLPDILRLAEQYGARVMVDEAHGTGVLGAHGAGTLEHYGLKGRADVVIGTFSKAFCATGGFVAASRDIVEYIRHYGRAYTFSASPSPSVMASVLAGLNIIRTEPALRDQLWANIRHLHAGLKSIGLKVYPDPPESAILTVLVGPDQLTYTLSKDLYEQGVFASTVAHPVVPPNRGTLRISLSALHTRDDLDRVLEIMAGMAGKYRLI